MDFCSRTWNRTWQWLTTAVLCAVLAGCPSSEQANADGSNGSFDIVVPDLNIDLNGNEPSYPRPCDEIYDPDEVPTFEIEVSEASWDALWNEYNNWDDKPALDGPLKSYYPVEWFRYEDEIYYDVAIRLKGSPDHWKTGKMQFNISFKEYNENQRFHGLRKLNLDAPHNDPTLLHDRLGLHIFRKLGLPASCANSARLVVNGEYYGLFVNIEHVDQEFLQRNFGDADEGNLYKWKEKKTHETDPDQSDLDAVTAAQPLATYDSLVDLEHTVLFWAAEAVIPQMDGYVVGGINYYLYNHPDRGFLLLPWDVDYSFDVDGEHTYYDVDPVTETVGWGKGKTELWKTVIADETWYAQYMGALAIAVEHYDVDSLHDLADEWAAQIAPYIAADPSKHFTVQEHQQRLEILRQFIVDRRAFMDQWLGCKDPSTFQENAVAMAVGGKNYSLWLTHCNWQDAVDRCSAMGGTLGLPTSDEEQEALSTALLQEMDQNWWIGANDIAVEGQWKTSDGKPVQYFRWGSDQPGDSDKQNCVVIAENLSGKWNDKPCEDLYPSVCRVE